MKYWNDIEGFSMYQVSIEGEVMNKKTGRLLKQTKTSDKKYLQVNLYNHGIPSKFRVHTLVAKAFPEICGEWFEGAQVNHKDENGLNNKACNLETCDGLYNSNYGTGKWRNGERHKIPVNQYSKDGVFIAQYASALDAQKATGVSRCVISSCCHGRKWYRTAGGFIWEFGK